MGTILPFLFLAAHVPLALIMNNSPAISTVHALLVVFAAIIFSLRSRGLEYAGYFLSYIAGAEVLWRMSSASVFWEFGKYAVVLVCVIAMIFRSGLRINPLALLYFAVLIPSSIFVADRLSWEWARKELSFNLSGPFSLFVGMCFFYKQRLSSDQARRLMIALMGPTVGILSIAVFSTFTADVIVFGDDSNKITSGGYGPNQVSAMLGLGALAAFYVLNDTGARKMLRFLVAILMLVFVIQSALTFSRGGLYMLIASVVPALFLMVNEPRKRLRMIVGTVAVVMLGWFVLFPALDSFTKGFLSVRFKDVQGTGRAEISRDDLRIWSDHFVMGVGPGMASEYRNSIYRGAAAHTEFTRLLAEHGIFGLIGLMLLALMGLLSIIRNRSPLGRAMATSLVIWSFLFMAINAMRLVMPSFLFALASAELFVDPEPDDSEEDTNEEA
jgi:hypothetical protein